MTDPRLAKFLGSADPDAGCDHAGEMMDEYVELLLAGEPIPERLAEFVTHIANCTACREDTESLLALIREEEKTDER
ncbi:MAG TPA: hypothetical protein VI259_03510 [Gemmatimonadaceae bacterium]